MSLLQTHGPYTYKQIVKTSISTCNNNNNKISQIKIVQISKILISNIAEWESEYRQ